MKSTLSSTKQLLNNIRNSGTNHQSTLPRPNNVPWFPPPLPPPLTEVTLFVFLKINFYSPLQSPHWHNRETKVMLRRQTLKFQVSTCLHACATENLSSKCCLLLYLLLLSSWWFGFPAILRVSLFQTEDDTDDSKNNCTCHCSLGHIVTVRSRIKVKRGKILQQSWSIKIRNGTVWYLAVSTHTLGPIHLRGRGEGYWLWKFSQFCLLINTGGGLD